MDNCLCSWHTIFFLSVVIKKRRSTSSLSYCHTMVMKLMVILSCDLGSNLTLSCPGFLVILSPGGLGTTPCYSFIWPSISLKLGTSIGMAENYSHMKNCGAIFRNDVTMTSFPMFATSLFLIQFCSNFVKRCFLVLQTKIQSFVEIDCKMTSQWRHQWFQGPDFV